MDRSRTESKKGYRALGGLVLLVVAGCGQPGGDERIREAYARKEAEAREAKQAADERREAAVASLDWITVPGGRSVASTWTSSSSPGTK